MSREGLPVQSLSFRLFLIRHVPDGIGILGDGPVRREDTAAGDIPQAHAVPRRPVAVGTAHPLLGIAVGGEVRQHHILVGGPSPPITSLCQISS